MNKKPVGVQLWTLRKEIAGDLAGTLAKVAEIGYAGVELWFPAWPEVAVLKAALAGSGLRVAGAHVPFVDLRDRFDQVAAYHAEIGNRDLVIPFLPQELRDSDAAWRQRIAEIGEIAVRCRDAGFRLSYHNHAFEFTDRVGGQEAHDAIFASVPADLLKAELDTFFIQDVGKDPAAYIRRYAGRLPLLHLKEKAKPAAGTQNAEVGDGIIDWDAVFAAAEGAGVEWYLVEQNCEAYPALQSIAMSLDFLRRRGIA